MRDDPYVVDPLSEIKLSWLVRRRLRRVRQRHETGVLMHGIIRTPARRVVEDSLATTSRSVLSPTPKCANGPLCMSERGFSLAVVVARSVPS